MFTGIITEKGEVLSLRVAGSGAVLVIRAPEAAADAVLGDSIAIDGACLTVTSIDGPVMSFDLSGETLKSTTLGSFSAGGRVNIESSMRAGGKFGGHMVSGHVDAVGTIRSRVNEAETVRYTIDSPEEVTRYLIDKGSVAVDGISLTVVAVMRNAFTLVIIPHTLAVTTLAGKQAGARVNLEADVIGKYVYRFLNKSESSDERLMKTLQQEGFAE